MRTLLIVFIVVYVALVSIYAYHTNPAGCRKLGRDVGTLLVSLMPGNTPPPVPVATTPDSAPPKQPPAASTSSSPNSTNSPIQSVPSLAPAPPLDTVPTPAAPSLQPIAPTPGSVMVPLPPIRFWKPPIVLPSQPNWEWTTTYGKTYQNVVVTKLAADTVSITHALGAADVPIETLSPDLQKQFNYDPELASFAKAERQRKLDHPYYPMARAGEAQAVAEQQHLPLAWLSGYKDDLAVPSPFPGEEAELTQFALLYLKNNTVIIFVNAADEMGYTPAIVHHQFSERDDGPLPGDANYKPPKIVFSTPDASKIYTRVSCTRLKAERGAALDEALAPIPTGAEVLPASLAPAPAPVSTTGTP